MRPEDLLDESRIERRCAQDDYMPYWANLWPASVALADYLLQSRLVPPDNNGLAVELGCGLGMPAVAAGLLGWQILLSDYDADALAFAEFNAAANGLQRFAGVLIDWRHLPQRIGADLVLGADVLYEPRLHQTLLSCINGIVAKDGVAILADPRRCGAKGFRWTARNAGWTVHMQAWADSNDRLRRIPVDLYILTRHR